MKDIDKVALHKWVTFELKFFINIIILTFNVLWFRNKIINIKKPSAKFVKNDNDKDSLLSLTSSEDNDEMMIEGGLDQEKMYISSDSDTEQEYEKTPRSNKAWIQNESTKLPIKLPDGKIKQVVNHSESND